MIGINEYEHHKKLNNAVKDITDISELLAAEYGYSLEPPFFKCLLNEEATRTNIIEALEELCEIEDAKAKILIYFAGHGRIKEVTYQGFWIPVEARKSAFADYVSNSDIRDHIKAMKARHVLLISDSCFSHSLFRDVVGEKMTKNIFDKWERNKSRWIFCSGKGVVSDGKKGENSPFARQIIKRLSEPEIDKINIGGLANDIAIAIGQNYDQVADARPLAEAGNDGGQFVFFRKIDILERLKIDFEKIKESSDQNELQDFLERSKDPEQKKIIRKRLRTLENIEKTAREAWAKLDKHSFVELDEFIDDYPESSFAKEAQLLKKQLRNNTINAEEPQKETPVFSTSSNAMEALNIKALIQSLRESDFEAVFSDLPLTQWFEKDRFTQNMRNTMILLESRYNSILKEEALGTLSRDRISIEKNRITQSLLSLLSSIEKRMKED